MVRPFLLHLYSIAICNRRVSTSDALRLAFRTHRMRFIVGVPSSSHYLHPKRLHEPAYRSPSTFLRISQRNLLPSERSANGRFHPHQPLKHSPNITLYGIIFFNFRNTLVFRKKPPSLLESGWRIQQRAASVQPLALLRYDSQTPRADLHVLLLSPF